jgi:hypothetical protein
MAGIARNPAGEGSGQQQFERNAGKGKGGFTLHTLYLKAINWQRIWTCDGSGQTCLHRCTASVLINFGNNGQLFLQLFKVGSLEARTHNLGARVPHSALGNTVVRKLIC